MDPSLVFLLAGTSTDVRYVGVSDRSGVCTGVARTYLAVGLEGVVWARARASSSDISLVGGEIDNDAILGPMEGAPAISAIYNILLKTTHSILQFLSLIGLQALVYELVYHGTQYGRCTHQLEQPGRSNYIAILGCF